MIIRIKSVTFGIFFIVLASYPLESLQQIPFSRQYVGCFADDFDRILPDFRCSQDDGLLECPDCAGARADDPPGVGAACQNSVMTLDICLSLCQNHTYAGLQSGEECYCGNADAVYRKLGENEAFCDIPCGGDPSQVCGGEFWASVYDLRRTCAIENLDPYIFPSEPTEYDGVAVIFNNDKTLTFECQNNYVLEGSASITCDESGSFSPNVPTCTPPRILSTVTCPSISAPAQGNIAPKQETFRAGEVARFACGIGYIIDGDSTLTCGDDGQWSANVPTCTEKLCPVPPSFSNADVVLNTLGRNVGGSAIYTCRPGFTKQIYATGRICNETFEWVGPDPVCVKVDPEPPPDNIPVDDPTGGVPALVWIFIVIVIICAVIFLAGCLVTRTGSSSGQSDYKHPDPFINDGIVVSRDIESEKYPHSTANTAAFVGPALATISNENDFGENYSSRETSVASGTWRGDPNQDFTATEADKYIDSLFDGMDPDDKKSEDDIDDLVGPYHPAMGGFDTPPREPSPYHHPEPYDDYPPPPPPPEPQYHDLEMDSPLLPQQDELDLPAHLGPAGSFSRDSMYLPPAPDYPSVADPANANPPSPSDSAQNRDRDFLDEVDDFFDGVNERIDNCMMQ